MILNLKCFLFIFFYSSTITKGSIVSWFPLSDESADAPLLSPVIFVPGDGGSQMDAIINKETSVHLFCAKKTDDWFNIWLNLELLVPLIIDCWIDNVKLSYDNVTRKTSNTAGVQIRIPGWGSSETVEWLDPTHASTGAYFKDIGNALVQEGYVRNISIRGAPYDFRKAPNENEQWFTDFRKLIEDSYDLNQKTPTTIIAHSMGALMTLRFLQDQDKSWKDKYITRIITLAGAWGGSMKAVKVYAIGDDLGSFALRGSVMRAEQITSPSLAWLLPSPLFWKPNEIMVKTASRNYTVAQLEEYFNDLEYPNGWEMRKDTIKYTENFAAPDVEIHCLYGSEVPTVESLVYKKGDLTGSPTLQTGNGDGTVNMRSLEGCTLWRDKQKNKIYNKEYPGVDHMSILSNPNVIKYIIGAVTPE